MSLLSLGGFFTEAVAETWMSIWLSLNSMVYGLISTIYQLFVTVANVSLFSDEVFEQITGRLYVIMGIAMLFIFAYNLVLMIINPEEKKSTGQTTKIVKETIISLVLIILLPTIFKYMNTFQYHVLNSNIIGQIILGDSTSEDDCDYADMEMLNTHIDAEKQDVSIGTYCVKGGAGGAAIGGTVGAVGGTTIGSAVPVVGNIIGHAAGLGIGAAAGGVIGCVGGTIVGGIKQIATWFGYNDNQVTTNLSASCQLYNALPDVEKGARIVAPTIFSAFYHPTKFGYNECVNYLKTCGNDSSCNYTFDEGNTSSDDTQNGKIDTEDEKKICAFYVYDVDMAKYSGNMAVFNEDSEFINRIKGDEDTFEFNYFLAFIAGCLGLYMFVCYTLAIGKRVAKLGFLQIVSPITVMMRIVPKQKEAIFDKWLKELLNTYLDVFIRLIIIYFSLFGVSLVPDVISNLFATTGGFSLLSGLASVVVILGILQFALEAPELFKQFFGGGKGNFSLKSPKKQLSDNKLAMGAMGLARGGFGSASRNMFRSIREGKSIGSVIGSTVGGLVGGARRGAKAGYGSTLDNLGMNADRAIDETTAKRKERAKYKALHGGNLRGVIKGRIGDSVAAAGSWTGFDGGRDILDTIKYEEDVISHFDDYESMYKSGGYTAMDTRLKEMKAAQAAGHGYDGISAGADLDNAISRLEQQMKSKRVDAIKNNLQNAAYVAYEFSQSLNSDPVELEIIREKLQLSDAQMDQLGSLTIKDNKVVDGNGNLVSEDLIVKLLEGDGSIDPITGKAREGLNGSSGALKGQLSADKLSVAYKHQTKLEQERKDKK